MDIDLSKPLEDYQLTFLDLETTGLDVVMGDAICEIGAFKVKNRKIVDKFHSLVNPKMAVPQAAYQIHKISDQDLKYAPPFEKLADKLLDFLKGTVLCAYNVEFDAKFIDYSLKRIGREPLNLPTVDILAMARDGLDLPRYNLGTVAKSLGIDCKGGLHRALDDALVTYQTFLKLIDGFKNKKIESLDDYVSLYSCSNDIFKIKEDKKIAILKEAIENDHKIDIKYFSSSNILEHDQVLPLRLVREGRFFYFLFQGQAKEPRRILLRRVLEVQIPSARA
ncbi:MAG: ribonuclease H-like domain-containing protein [Candidatus Omnitrophica bacterium]|nr:ribonuclease H-like domain-containing protein [Candidatus Omnitrophota bacterium]